MGSRPIKKPNSDPCLQVHNSNPVAQPNRPITCSGPNSRSARQAQFSTSNSRPDPIKCEAQLVPCRESAMHAARHAHRVQTGPPARPFGLGCSFISLCMVWLHAHKLTVLPRGPLAQVTILEPPASNQPPLAQPISNRQTPRPDDTQTARCCSPGYVTSPRFSPICSSAASAVTYVAPCMQHGSPANKPCSPA